MMTLEARTLTTGVVQSVQQSAVDWTIRVGKAMPSRQKKN